MRPRIRRVRGEVEGEVGAPLRARRPWWSLAAVPLFGVGLWTLAADVPGWNAVWYLFAWYGWLLGLDAAVYALSRRSWNAEHGNRPPERSRIAGPERRPREPSWIAAQGWRLPALLFASVPFWYLYEAYNLRLENWYYVFTLRADPASSWWRLSLRPVL